MGKRRVTLRDIAEQAGVSVSTVSLVLNDKAQDGNVRISDQTVRQVREIAVASGYLSRGIVGLIVPQINSYFSPMIIGIMEVLREKKYSLAMGLQTSWDLQQEINEVRIMEDKGFDGLIVAAIPQFAKQVDEYPYLFQNRNQVVLMNCVSHSGIPYVTINHERCGYLAAKHLLELGHRRVAYVGGHYLSADHTTDASILDARFRGYFRAMHEYGQSCISMEDAEDLFNLPEKVTAVYCGKALLATDLLNVCRDRGVQVPEDLSIVGQDDNRERVIMRPCVTTVDVRAEEVGRWAAQMALDLIEGKEVKSIVLEPELIVRKSTRPL